MEHNVVAVLDLLLTVGYVDGLLHADERTFIDGYKQWLGDNFAGARERMDQVYAQLDAEIAALAAEVTAANDQSYTRTRLKVRAVALFRSFPPEEQEGALALLGQMMHVDGTVSPQERELHDELVALFRAAPAARATMQAPAVEAMRVEAPVAKPPSVFVHPLLDRIERPLAGDPATIKKQLGKDYQLVFQTIEVWEKQRSRGNGRLTGIADLEQVPAGTRWLDDHVHVIRPDRPTELVVLGDLHGCYACFKAALMQSQFIQRALDHQKDPANHPDIKLVLLGDYLDRGRFSFDGVMRAALHLQVSLPEHVILLRGNHEFMVRLGDTVVSGVNPAEAVPALSQHATADQLQAYRHLFEHMPTSLVFDRVLFVHAGIPRDETSHERYRDLGSLNDPLIRFEMMWSDPVNTDVVPPSLQRESPRFSFGHEQFRAFMQRVGCHTLIRGHEQIDAGFATVFDDGHTRLHTLFSAGGKHNKDLPEDSRYRTVKPMALTLTFGDGPLRAQPWVIDYEPFTYAAHNGFYR